MAKKKKRKKSRTLRPNYKEWPEICDLESTKKSWMESL